MGRGRLRVYLGSAPGVGKTYAMLAEGGRRAGRGTDVVVGFVETHGRPRTAALLEGLEIVPRAVLSYRGADFTEMDTDAVVARRPQVALIDELAHTNVPGSPRTKRWQDIERILDAGIDVVTNVNVQHLESVNDVVEQITGVPQRETVPDEVVRRADQVELVDMTPEALRRRMAHGNIYPPEKIDAALGNYFRAGNLIALRELALLWLAGKVDDQLDRYRAEHGIAGTWEARERVVVALTGGPEGDTLIRRAARIADRTKGADLLAVHVARSDGLAGVSPANLTRQRALTESLGGSYHQVVGANVPDALLDFARGVNATQLVLGASRRGKFAQLFSPGVGVTTTARSGSIDVHLVTHEETGQGRRWRALRAAGLPAVRRGAGFALAAAGLPLLTLLLVQMRAQVPLASDILLFQAAVVGVALVGGLYPALFAAIGGSLLLNYFFTPPTGQFTVQRPQGLLQIAVFVVVGVTVSTVVDVTARRGREAAGARADAEVLSTLAGDILRGEHGAVTTRGHPYDALGGILERLRETFALTTVTLLERDPDAPVTPDSLRDPDCWGIVASTGGEPCTSPDAGEADVLVEDGTLSLVLRGRTMPASDRRVLEAFAAQAAVALHHRRLAEKARQVRPLEAAEEMRTALLTTVSRDLRAPLASARAAVESLREPGTTRTGEHHDALAATAADSLARLDHLVADLMDMSRLQSGSLDISARRVAAEEAVPRAVRDDRRDVELRIPAGLPQMVADPALLRRVLANVIANAVRFNPPGAPVLVTASALGDRLEIRVIDRGPGVRPAGRDRLFQPLQRLGGRDDEAGVDLALARGLAEAMDGDLTPEETPGGGLTMVLTMPTRPPPPDGRLLP